MDNNKEVGLLNANDIAKYAIANYGETDRASVFAFGAGFAQSNAEYYYKKLLLEEVEKAWDAALEWESEELMSDEGIVKSRTKEEYMIETKKRLNIE